jgi:hypothetical protein
MSEIVPVLLGQVNSERALSVFQNYDYAGQPLTASDYEALVRSTYGASADAVLAEYPLDSFDSPSIAWTTMQNDSTSYTREVLFGQLSRHVPTFAYELAEKDTPQWPRYRQNTGEIMSLSACDTSPATGASPAACSAATDQFGGAQHGVLGRPRILTPLPGTRRGVPGRCRGDSTGQAPGYPRRGRRLEG